MERYKLVISGLGILDNIAEDTLANTIGRVVGTISSIHTLSAFESMNMLRSDIIAGFDKIEVQPDIHKYRFIDRGRVIAHLINKPIRENSEAYMQGVRVGYSGNYDISTLLSRSERSFVEGLATKDDKNSMLNILSGSYVESISRIPNGELITVKSKGTERTLFKAVKKRLVGYVVLSAGIDEGDKGIYENYLKYIFR